MLDLTPEPAFWVLTPVIVRKNQGMGMDGLVWLFFFVPQTLDLRPLGRHSRSRSLGGLNGHGLSSGFWAGGLQSQAETKKKSGVKPTCTHNNIPSHVKQERCLDSSLLLIKPSCCPNT